jgi:hypothetical protein
MLDFMNGSHWVGLNDQIEKQINTCRHLTEATKCRCMSDKGNMCSFTVCKIFIVSQRYLGTFKFKLKVNLIL